MHLTCQECRKQVSTDIPDFQITTIVRAFVYCPECYYRICDEIRNTKSSRTVPVWVHILLFCTILLLIESVFVYFAF